MPGFSYDGFETSHCDAQTNTGSASACCNFLQAPYFLVNMVGLSTLSNTLLRIL